MFRTTPDPQYISSPKQAVQQNYSLPPRPPSLSYHKIYRIILNSNDKQSGTIDNGIYYVNLPKSPQSNKCMLFVDFFAFEDESNSAITNLDRYMYNVHIRELVQPNTFRSLTKGPSDIILTTKGREYDGVPSWDGIGIPLTNKKMFEGNTINVYLTSRNISSTMLQSRDWTMVLVILEYDE